MEERVKCISNCRLQFVSIWTSVKFYLLVMDYTCPKQQILDSPKLKEFAADNFEVDENGGKFSERVENAVGKGEIARDEQFLLSHRVFKRLVRQTRKNQGLFGKGLRVNQCKNLPCCKKIRYSNSKAVFVRLSPLKMF